MQGFDRLEAGALMEQQSHHHFRAVRMLAATTVFWSLSFPLVKAITIVQDGLIPGSASWFHAGLTGFTRFACAALVLALFSPRALSRVTGSELWEGAGLGFFSGSGILLQMDGLSHTSASTSAFLTQAFCVVVPIIVAFRDRQAPSSRVVIALLLLMLGVAILSNFNFQTLRLGRGETETLISALFFGAQIVWLERPIFARNNVQHFSMVMFATMALMSFPLVLLTWQKPADVWLCYSNPAVLLLTAALTLFCTVIAFVAMNKWQRFVPATEAAIIYGAEPVFASLLTLFLPGLISRFAQINYPNERITGQLLIGGALVLAANLILQLRQAAPNRSEGAL
ncbi:MAG TPA: DMT family transporter [Verrucomicrobiae bacterium]|nr:DMT family transporter [Verrucomicrobiae bacterium]